MSAISDFLALCATWKLDDTTCFAKIVENAPTVLGVYQRELADDFAVAESTISRWAAGTSTPHRKVQQVVVAALKRRARRLKDSAPKTAAAFAEADAE